MHAYTSCKKVISELKLHVSVEEHFLPACTLELDEEVPVTGKLFGIQNISDINSDSKQSSVLVQAKVKLLSWQPSNAHLAAFWTFPEHKCGHGQTAQQPFDMTK